MWTPKNAWVGPLKSHLFGGRISATKQAWAFFVLCHSLYKMEWPGPFRRKTISLLPFRFRCSSHCFSWKSKVDGYAPIAKIHVVSLSHYSSAEVFFISWNALRKNLNILIIILVSSQISNINIIWWTRCGLGYVNTDGESMILSKN